MESEFKSRTSWPWKQCSYSVLAPNDSQWPVLYWGFSNTPYIQESHPTYSLIQNIDKKQEISPKGLWAAKSHGTKSMHQISSALWKRELWSGPHSEPVYPYFTYNYNQTGSLLFQFIDISSRYVNNNKKQLSTASAAHKREWSKLSEKWKLQILQVPSLAPVNDDASSENAIRGYSRWCARCCAEEVLNDESSLCKEAGAYKIGLMHIPCKSL